MADLLTHVLVGFTLGTGLSIRFDRIREPFVTVVMLGSLLPDLTKISMILPSAKIQAILGVPFDWFVLHTPIGIVFVAGICSLLVDTEHRLRVLLLLLTGAGSHFALDALLLSPSRFSHILLWPVSTMHIPLPALYLSSDRWPAMAAVSVAVVIWYIKRRARQQ